MQLLITGARTPLAEVAVDRLRQRHDLRLTDFPTAGEAAASAYVSADLRVPEQVQPLVAGVDAILHLAPYAIAPTPDARSEREVLDQSGRGTFVLLHEALKAGVKRIVLASRLDLMAAYPDDYLVDETWKPLPDTSATALAPYLAELTVREFVRAEALLGVCLRLDALGEGGIGAEDAAAALERALLMDPAGQKYHWWLYHVSTAGRFSIATAAKEPLSWAPAGG